MTSPNPILRASDLYAGYGRRSVLEGVSLQVRPGTLLAVIGHNGAGKSTLLRVLSGILAPLKGDVTFDGFSVCRLHTAVLRRLGLVYVPQGHRVFPRMTVRQQLTLVAATSAVPSRNEALERLQQLFPELVRLLPRRAGLLSGGERQIVSLAMALVGAPRTLLFDEPSYGLAPHLVERVLGYIRSIADGGCAVVLVEQRIRAALAIADEALVIRRGHVTFSGSPDMLAGDDHFKEVFI